MEGDVVNVVWLSQYTILCDIQSLPIGNITCEGEDEPKELTLNMTLDLSNIAFSSGYCDQVQG